MEGSIPKPGFQNKQADLHVHEWLAVVVILGFMSLLTAITVYKGSADITSYENRCGKDHYLKLQEVEVFIDGAVAKPGSYKLKLGMPVVQAVSFAEPLANADLKRIRPLSKVRNGQHIHVSAKSMIAIVVDGAVKAPGRVLIPKGTKMCDLKNYIEFNLNADLSRLDRKRCLKENELVNVPVRQSKRGG